MAQRQQNRKADPESFIPQRNLRTDWYLAFSGPPTPVLTLQNHPLFLAQHLSMPLGIAV